MTKDAKKWFEVNVENQHYKEKFRGKMKKYFGRMENRCIFATSKQEKELFENAA